MIPATAPKRAPSSDLVNRRLVSGLLLSIVIHGLVLSLQFGRPGLGPVPIAPLSVRITNPETPPQAAPAAADPLPAAPPRPETGAGMTLLEPVPRPKPIPPRPVARKKKPSQARRISTPMPGQAPTETPTRVIAQDQNPNQEFLVPLPRPEEALQKTIDPKEAQHGTEEGKEAVTVLPETVAETVTEMVAQAQELAEVKRREDAAALLALQARAAAQAAAEREDGRRRQLEQAEQAERQRAAALALLEDQAAQQQALRQQALRIETARVEQLMRQEQQRKEREAAVELEARKLAEEQAQQQAAARRQLEQQAAKQKADQLAARQQAEQAAQQRAADTAAQSQAAGSAAAAGPVGRPDGSGSQALVPKDLFSSDLVNRAREASRGLDILSGTPPRAHDERTRRRVVVGATERDVPLRMYVESWRQKIERNGSLNYSQLSSQRVRIDPLVSVAIRSDGSVEEVTLIRSTGRAEMDEAVRRIVRVNARYSAFPPNIAAKYDVIEIRRIWNFDETLKLLEEMR